MLQLLELLMTVKFFLLHLVTKLVGWFHEPLPAATQHIFKFLIEMV